MAYRLDPELAAIARMAPPLDLRDVPAARRGMAAIARELAAAGGRPATSGSRCTTARSPGLPVPRRFPCASTCPRNPRVRGPSWSTSTAARSAWATSNRSTRAVCGSAASSGSPSSPSTTGWRRSIRFPPESRTATRRLVWAARNLRELGGDADRLAIGGASAGGGLAAGAALMARDRGGPALAFQLLIYPVLDDRMNTRSMQRLLRHADLESTEFGIHVASLSRRTPRRGLALCRARARVARSRGSHRPT